MYPSLMDKPTGEVVPEPEAVDHLAETVEVVVLGERGAKLNELVLIYDVRALGSEKDVIGGFPDDLKPEAWVIAPGELNIAIGSEVARAGPLLDSGFRD